MKRGGVFLVAIGLAVGCRTSADDEERDRTAALEVAQDTATRSWRHEVGVDSVRMDADTTVVWVSPRNWLGTDAPQAGVRVLPRGRIVRIQWVLGG